MQKTSARQRSTVPLREDRVEAPFTLGRQAYEKISAVEGIRLSRDMERDLRDARAEGRSPEEARALLRAKYGNRCA